MQKSTELKLLFKELINCFSAEKWNGKIYPFFIQEGKKFQTSIEQIK